MQIFLTNMCASLTGSLSKRHGYSIKHRKNGFFGVRNPKNVPRDGHWRFIVDCACMARDGFMISDIEVSGSELNEALEEAGHILRFNEGIYHADDIMKFKMIFGL